MKRFKRKTKKITSIYLEKELVETAKELGLNISKVCEIALKERITALSSLGGIKNEPRAGFEPAANNLRGCRSDL